MPIGIIALLLFLGLFIWALLTPSSMDKAIQQAKEKGNIDSILIELQKKPLPYQGRFFSQTMTRLWDRKDYELAILLIQEFVQTHPKSIEGQRWIRNILDASLQPSLVFEQGFVEKHYHPQCIPGGPSG